MLGRFLHSAVPKKEIRSVFQLLLQCSPETLPVYIEREFLGHGCCAGKDGLLLLDIKATFQQAQS
jgi:hypothetical protein